MTTKQKKTKYIKPAMQVYELHRQMMLQVTSRSYDPSDDNPFGTNP